MLQGEWGLTALLVIGSILLEHALCPHEIIFMCSLAPTINLSGTSQPPQTRGSATNRMAGSDPLHAVVPCFHSVLASTSVKKL